jgi:putative DNA primase/helicase
LYEIFVDDTDADDKIECLLQMIGYTLMSHSQHEKFIMLIGNGANGKSVCLAVLEALCGTENIAGVQPSQFDRTFQRAELHNKLANIVTELSEGEKLADAELKSITSGEPVTVERKHKDPFVMRPYSTCWFGTNHMPKTNDFSEALFRRAVIITFNRTFQPHEQNTDLKKDLIQELPGILNLALGAYARAITHGFTIPKSSRQASKDWKAETDQVAKFVSDVCTTISDGVTPTATLYNSYLKWCNLNQMRNTLTIKSFSTRMTKLGYYRSKSGNVRTFRGLVLNS